MNRDSQYRRAHLVGHVDGQWSQCVPNSTGGEGRGGGDGRGGAGGKGAGGMGGEGQGGMGGGGGVTPVKAGALLGSVNRCPRNSF